MYSHFFKAQSTSSSVGHDHNNDDSFLSVEYHSQRQEMPSHENLADTHYHSVHSCSADQYHFKEVNQSFGLEFDNMNDMSEYGQDSQSVAYARNAPLRVDI